MTLNSVIALLGALVITYFLSGILEGPMVGALASTPPGTMEELMVARNETAVFAGRIAIAGFVGLLAGYMVAKIAGQYELTHAMVAALVQGVLQVRSFAAEPAAANVPAWLRGAFVLVMVGAMVAGAMIRARAARLEPTTEIPS